MITQDVSEMGHGTLIQKSWGVWAAVAVYLVSEHCLQITGLCSNPSLANDPEHTAYLFFISAMK